MNTKNLLLIVAAVLVVLVGGGAYLLSKNQAQPKVETQSSSDELSSIEKDLNDTDTEGIDKEMVQIDAELNTGFY